MKKTIFSVIAIYIAWSAMDFVIHNIMLSDLYGQTAELWRPMEEMKMGLMAGVTAISALVFTLLYQCFVNPKSVQKGVGFGLLFGIAAGVSMGFGMYSVMPIPTVLGVSWFAASLAQGVVAGLIAGAIYGSAPEAG